MARAGRGLGDRRSRKTGGQETTARTSLYQINFSPVLDGRAVVKSRHLKTIFRAWRQWLPRQFVDYRLTGHRLPQVLRVARCTYMDFTKAPNPRFLRETRYR